MVEISGKIQSGAGKGAYFTQVDWVIRQCEVKLGFAPFPGTLNINVRNEDLPKLDHLLKTAEIELVPEAPGFCVARVQPVMIQGIPAAVVLPSDEVRIHKDGVIEIISSCSLKQTLGLEDGDRIVIESLPKDSNLYTDIYAFASSAGALEGYVYSKPVLKGSHLEDWIKNLKAQYEALPDQVRESFQPALDRTLGRTIQSVALLLSDDHPHIAMLKSMVVGDIPMSADDFSKEKADKAAKYGH